MPMVYSQQTRQISRYEREALPLEFYTWPYIRIGSTMAHWKLWLQWLKHGRLFLPKKGQTMNEENIQQVDATPNGIDINTIDKVLNTASKKDSEVITQDDEDLGNTDTPVLH